MLRTSAALVLVCVFGLAGCGEPYAVPEIATDVNWHSDPRTSARTWGLDEKELGRLVLPEARHAGEDREGEIQRLIINVSRGGDVYFRGWQWRLGNAPEAEHPASLDAIAGTLAPYTRDPRFRNAADRSLIPLFLHADRETAWRWVRAVVRRAATERDIRTERLQWAVWSPAVGLGRDARQEGVLREAAPPAHALSIALTATDGVAWPTLALAIGDRTSSFGELPQTPWQDEAFLARANRIWDEAEAALETQAAPGRPVALRIAAGEQELPWAFVVQLFDVLLGAGLVDVYLVEAGLHVALRVPDAPTGPPQEDAPVVTPLVLLLCALAVGLAFWIAFRPLAGRRRRKA